MLAISRFIFFNVIFSFWRFTIFHYLTRTDLSEIQETTEDEEMSEDEIATHLFAVSFDICFVGEKICAESL